MSGTPKIFFLLFVLFASSIARASEKNIEWHCTVSCRCTGKANYGGRSNQGETFSDIYGPYSVVTSAVTEGEAKKKSGERCDFKRTFQKEKHEIAWRCEVRRVDCKP